MQVSTYRPVTVPFCSCKSEAECSCPRCIQCGHVVDGHTHAVPEPGESEGERRLRLGIPFLTVGDVLRHKEQRRLRR